MACACLDECQIIHMRLLHFDDLRWHSKQTMFNTKALNQCKFDCYEGLIVKDISKKFVDFL